MQFIFEIKKVMELSDEKATKWIRGFWVGETTHAILMKKCRKRQQNINQYMRMLATRDAQKEYDKSQAG